MFASVLTSVFSLTAARLGLARNHSIRFQMNLAVATMLLLQPKGDLGEREYFQETMHFGPISDFLAAAARKFGKWKIRQRRERPNDGNSVTTTHHGVSDTTCTPTRGGASHTGWGRSDTAEHQEHARLGCSWRPEWWRDSLLLPACL